MNPAEHETRIRELEARRQMRPVLLALVLAAAACAAPGSSLRWCEAFCADRTAAVSEQASGRVAVAVCSCSSRVAVEFACDAEKSIDRGARCAR